MPVGEFFEPTGAPEPSLPMCVIDTSRRSRVNEVRSAEEKKITSGHSNLVPRVSHLTAWTKMRDPGNEVVVTGACNLISMREISSEIELGHRLDTPMSAGN